MKKLLTSTLAAFVLLATGSAFAQVQSVDHELYVSIPEVVMIRIVTTDTATASVQFDYADAANQGAYFTALENDGDWLPPTSGNISAIEVLAIGTDWEIDVTAGAFTLTGLDLADIEVTPSATFGTPFTLDAGTAALTGGATNWTSLGIDWESYALYVDGDEDAGDDTITVTYTITDI